MKQQTNRVSKLNFRIKKLYSYKYARPLKKREVTLSTGLIVTTEFIKGIYLIDVQDVKS